MKRIFSNENGNTYLILFGKLGESAFLINTDSEQYVICGILEENSWTNGSYFNDFEEAYRCWKKEI